MPNRKELFEKTWEEFDTDHTRKLDENEAIQMWDTMANKIGRDEFVHGLSNKFLEFLYTD